MHATQEEAHKHAQVDSEECFLTLEHSADIASRIVAANVAVRIKESVTRRNSITTQSSLRRSIATKYSKATKAMAALDLSDITVSVGPIIQLWLHRLDPASEVSDTGHRDRPSKSAEGDSIIWEDQITDSIEKHLEFLQLVRTIDASQLDLPSAGEGSHADHSQFPLNLLD